MNCQRCGACCKVIAIPVGFLAKDYLEYLKVRGLTIDNRWIIIPQRCQYLSSTNLCMIHDLKDRPLACRKFEGQKQIGKFRIYIPEGCVFR